MMFRGIVGILVGVSAVAAAKGNLRSSTTSLRGLQDEPLSSSTASVTVALGKDSATPVPAPTMNTAVDAAPTVTLAPTESNVPVFQALYRLDFQTVARQDADPPGDCAKTPPPASIIHAVCNGTAVLTNVSDPSITCQYMSEDTLEEVLGETQIMVNFSSGLTCRQANHYEMMTSLEVGGNHTGNETMLMMANDTAILETMVNMDLHVNGTNGTIVSTNETTALLEMDTTSEALEEGEEEVSPWGSVYYTCQGIDVGHVDTAVVYQDDETDPAEAAVVISRQDDTSCPTLDYQRLSQLAIMCGRDEYKNKHAFFECELPSVPMNMDDLGGRTQELVCGNPICDATGENNDCDDDATHKTEIVADHYQFDRGCVLSTDAAVVVPHPVGTKPLPSDPLEAGTYVAKFRANFGTLFKDDEETWGNVVTGADCFGDLPAVTIKCGSGQEITQIIGEVPAEAELEATVAPEIPNVDSNTSEPTIAPVIVRELPAIECAASGVNGLNCLFPPNSYAPVDLYQYFNAMSSIVYVSCSKLFSPMIAFNSL